MDSGKYLFTSESVSMGHPDKVSDQISDAVLDFCLEHDPKSRVACETLVTTDLAVVAGEITTAAPLNRNKIDRIVREVIKDIGYTDPKIGFAADTCQVDCRVHSQSPHISQGVDVGGAGDQGLMFGFACKDTQALMPLPIHLSHRLVDNHAQKRRSGEIAFLRPDAKSQVTVEYEKGTNLPLKITTIVLSTQHDESVLTCRDGKDLITEEARQVVIDRLVRPTIESERPDLIKGKLVLMSIDEPNRPVGENDIRCYINPTGCFLVGGPHGDCGLTGRKIIVDSYGGWGRHGGGAFSGKDPTKVDRSAAYMARHVAKNVVAAGLAERCEVQLAYAIGVAEPVSVYVDTQGTGRIPEDKLSELVARSFPLSPRGIIEYLDLRRPIYRKTAAGGHFGRTEKEFSWESTHRAEELAKAAGVSGGRRLATAST